MKVTHWAVALPTLIFSALASSAFAGPATITFIEPPAEYMYIQHGPVMSKNGHVVTGELEVPQQASLPNMGMFLWTAKDGSISLDFTPVAPDANSHVSVHAISGDGSIIAGQLNAKDNIDFTWSSQTGFEVFPQHVHAVSHDGEVLSGTHYSCGEHSYRWTAEDGFECIGSLLDSSDVDAISPDGNAIIGRSEDYSTKSWGQAFRWTSATGLVGLGDFPGGDFGSTAFDLSDDGSVVVGMSDIGPNQNAGFRWTAQTGMVQIVGLTSAVGVSGDGSLVLGHGGVAKLWSECLQVTPLQALLENVYGLDFQGWEINNVWNLSSNGRTMLVSLDPIQGGELKPAVITIPFVPTSTCAADVHPATCGDRAINVDDLLAVINNWGECEVIQGQRCPGDVVVDEIINVDDLLGVINAWGECP